MLLVSAPFVETSQSVELQNTLASVLWWFGMNKFCLDKVEWQCVLTVCSLRTLEEMNSGLAPKVIFHTAPSCKNRKGQSKEPSLCPAVPYLYQVPYETSLNPS